MSEVPAIEQARIENEGLQKMEAAMACEQIPEHMREGLAHYIMYGLRPGHFLQAVLENDLKEAVARADGHNAAALAGYVRFLYNGAPIMCWGTEELVNAWVKLGGLKGYLRLKQEAL